MSDAGKLIDTGKGRDQSRRGLRWKIIAWSFIPTTIFLIAVTAVAYIAYQLATENMLLERNQDLARLSARQLASEFQTYTELLESVSRTPSLTDGTPLSVQAALDSQSSRLVVFNAGVLLMDNYGEVQASLPFSDKWVRADFSDRPYFREVIRTERPAFSDILADGLENQDVIAFAVPMTDTDGQILGVLAGMFEVSGSSSSSLYGDIVKLHMSENGSAFVVDSNGRVIYHSRADYIGADLSYHEPVLRLESGQSDVKRTKGLDNQEVLASFATIPGTSWGLVLEETWTSLLQDGMRYRTPILGLLVLGVVIPTLVVAVGVQRITDPIQQLVEASARVGRGKFDQFIDVQTGDEIEELADQFNIMSHALQDSYNYLEQRVDERTRELSVLLSAAREASSTLDLEQVLGHIANALAAATEAQHCAIYLFDENTRLFIPTSASVSESQGGDQLGDAYHARPINPGEDAFIAEMIALAEPVVADEISTDDRFDTYFSRDLDVHSMLAVPFLVKDRLLAAAIIASTDDSIRFGDSQIELVWGIANTAAITIENAYLFHEVDQRMREVQALYRADEELYRDLSVDRVLESLLDAADEILDADKSCILVFDPERGRLQVQASKGFSREVLGRMDFKPGEGIAGHVLIDKQPVFIESTSDHPEVQLDITGPENIASFAHLPIMIGDTIFGIFNLSYISEHTFSESERRIAAALAQRSALVIENARLYEAEKRQLRDTERRQQVAEGLQEILSVLNKPQPIDEIYSEIVPLAVKLLGADGGALYAFDRETNLISTKAACGTPEGFKEIDSTPINDTAAFHAALEGQPYTSQDARARLLDDRQDPEQIEDPWLAFVLKDFNAFLSVPLTVAGEVFGAITLFYQEARPFRNEDVHLAMNFARQTALAIENAQLRERMQRTAVLEERSRLARDLHDSVSQTLFSATLIAEVLPRLWERNESQGLRRLEELRELTRGALAEMRTLLLELRPMALVEAPLPELLEQLCESTIGRARIDVELEVDGSCEIPAKTKIALYRIAQEALNNVAKHSNAENARVILTCQSGRVLLSIHDDGTGFDPQHVSGEHLGLNIMRERAEQNAIFLDLTTSPARGTEVSAVWTGSPEGNKT